jgi:hypothetical protein
MSKPKPLVLPRVPKELVLRLRQAAAAVEIGMGDGDRGPNCKRLGLATRAQRDQFFQSIWIVYPNDQPNRQYDARATTATCARH